MTRLPNDSPARERIRTDLATNMLVEAGAGSGKTTALVERMLEYVRRGTPVERLAAVTFTRKAANELRERFQERLEQGVREGDPASEESLRIERALRDLDRSFLGTIHAFCARLLRERPLEVGLDPDFQEVSEEDWADLRAHFWRRWVERAKRAGDADLAALAHVGVDPGTLAGAFARVLDFPDVEFPLAESAPPDIAPCRREVERLMEAARALMPAEEPEGGWDDLMRLVRRLEFQRGVGDWRDVAQFCAAAEGVTKSSCDIVQQRWAGKKGARSPEAKALAEDWLACLGAEIADLLRCWREHRYPFVMRVLQRAALDFQRERHATGQLGFEDLLLLTARLLGEHPAVRDELGARYAHLLVDEFQDTDPVQAEVCFLLASDSAGGSDWRTVTPRPGSLFVVGDPKQSIYRFRRADIQVYEFVKRRMETCGAVLTLTSNFRSVRAIERVVNGHFASAFPAEATAEQAAYRPMETVHEDAGDDGVFRYRLNAYGTDNREALLSRDAALVASWIAGRVASGARRAGDFLILSATKAPIAFYARALAARNIPVSTTGAPLPQEHELTELLVVLRAIADPESAVHVVAALEGLFFGLSHAELWEASQAGLRFAITHPPASEELAAGRALCQLHDWWKLSQRHPADVLLEEMLDETGLLFHAAGADLGEARAGALLHLVGVARASAAVNGGGITDMMDRLEVLLGAEAPDAPLRPGRTDAVRVMNLHKAKGLEAEVVILAAPLDESPRPPDVHVARGASGTPVGGIEITRKVGQGRVIIAQPQGWGEMQEVEQRFATAERARLLYVAATRARRELVVAQAEYEYKSKASEPDASLWRPLAPVLDGTESTVLRLEVTPPAGRRTIAATGTALGGAARDAAARVQAASAATFSVQTVTDAAKGDGAAGKWRATADGAGAAWGRAVHRAIEGLGRGRQGASLERHVRAVGRDEVLSPERIEALVSLVAEVEASATWRRLAADGLPHVELNVMQRSMDGEQVVMTEGKLDAASLGPDGWRVVDWKSDVVDDATWARRRDQYERQVASYAAMLGAVTGASARGEVERIAPPDMDKRAGRA